MFSIFEAYLQQKITLTPAELEHIKSLSFIKKLRKKQYLLQEGDVWKYHAFITTGCLRTYTVDEKGLEHIISFLR